MEFKRRFLTRAKYSLALSVCCCPIFSGCGGGGDVVPVTGKVTFQGKPVPQATVTFTPDEAGKLSVGTTGEDGTYELKVAGSEDQFGAKAGSHRVSITAMLYEDPSQSAQSEGVGSMAMMASKAKMRSLLPPTYASPSTSGLTFEVKPSGENEANFDLGK